MLMNRPSHTWDFDIRLHITRTSHTCGSREFSLQGGSKRKIPPGTFKSAPENLWYHAMSIMMGLQILVARLSNRPTPVGSCHRRDKLNINLCDKVAAAYQSSLMAQSPTPVPDNSRSPFFNRPNALSGSYSD
jgi:hypothetical protein